MFGLPFIARKKLHGQAQKALYALFYKMQYISIPINVQQITINVSLVVPILLYSDEVWD